MEQRLCTMMILVVVQVLVVQIVQWLRRAIALLLVGNLLLWRGRDEQNLRRRAQLRLLLLLCKTELLLLVIMLMMMLLMVVVAIQMSMVVVDLGQLVLFLPLVVIHWIGRGVVSVWQLLLLLLQASVEV